MTDLVSEKNNLMVAAQSFKGKSIVSLSDGQRIGALEEVLIQPDTFVVKGLLTAKGSLFNSTVLAIPKSNVRLWGKDVVLVDQPDVIKKKEDLPELASAVTVSDYIPGRAVVTTSGNRVGNLKDVYISLQGELTGIELSRVTPEFTERLKDQQDEAGDTWLPKSMVHSLGKDVVVVDLPEEKENPPENIHETQAQQ